MPSKGENETQGCAPAAVQEGDSKGALATKLGVALLEVTDHAHELLAGNGLLVREHVALRRDAAVVDQNVGIRCTRMRRVSGPAAR